MQDKERIRRRRTGMDAKRRCSAFLSAMLAAVMTLNMPLSVLGAEGIEAFASVSNSKAASKSDAGEKGDGSGADRGSHSEPLDMEEGWMTAKNAEYRPGARQDVDIYVIAEDNDVVPGNMSTMRIYLKNNTGSAIADGTLSFTGSRIRKEDGVFTEISKTGMAGGASMDTAGGLDVYEGLDEDRLDEIEALEAEAYAREFGKDEDGEGLTELTGLYLEPGQLHEIEFAFYTDDGAGDGKAYVDFRFQGEGGEGKIRSSEKFYYSIGLPSVNIELLDGQALETGVEHELSIWMSAPSWTDYEVEEVQIPVEKIEAATAAEVKGETETKAEDTGDDKTGAETAGTDGSQTEAAKAESGAEGTKTEDAGAESVDTGTETEGAGAEDVQTEAAGTEEVQEKETGAAGTEEVQEETEAQTEEETQEVYIIEDEAVPVVVETGAAEDLALGRSARVPAVVCAPLMRTEDTSILAAGSMETEAKDLTEDAVQETSERKTAAEVPAETKPVPPADPAGQESEGIALAAPESTAAEDRTEAEGGDTAQDKIIENSTEVAVKEDSTEAAVAEDSTEAAVAESGTETAPEESAEDKAATKAGEEAVAREAEQADQMAQALAIKESKVSYTLEVFGTEFKKFRPKKIAEAEDIGWIACLYQLAEDARPGVYYGKVTANGTWQKRSFTTSQGFLFEITGEGAITLKSKLDGMSVEVSGPVSSFPEADELELLIEALSREEQEAVEEALDGEGMPYAAFSLSLLANGESADTQGPVTVKISDQTIKEDTAQIVAAREAQAAAAASMAEQAEGSRAETEPQTETEPQAEASVRKGPGAAGRMSGRALLAGDGSLLEGEEKKEEDEETVIANSKAANLTLMKVDTRSAQTKGLEAGVTESGALLAETSEIMATYAVTREGEGAGEPEETDTPGETDPAVIHEMVAAFAELVNTIYSGYFDDTGNVYRAVGSLHMAIEEAGKKEEQILRAAPDAGETEDVFSSASDRLSEIRNAWESERSVFDGYLERFKQEAEGDTAWSAHFTTIQDALRCLDRYQYGFSEEEYADYHSQLMGGQFRAALREMGEQLAHMEPEALKEVGLSELIEMIESLEGFRSYYLDPTDPEVTAGTTEEEREQATKLAGDFASIRAAVFLERAERLKQEVKADTDGSYSGYTGYHKFSIAMDDVCRLQDEEADIDLDEETKAKVAAAREELKALRYQLSTAITPDALEAFEKFRADYEALMREHEDPESYAKWGWENTEDRTGTRDRIKALFRLADILPAELFEQIKEQRAELERILSEEAEKEFERILEVLEEWYKAPEEELDKDKMVKAAEELLGYFWYTQEQLERLELLKNGNKSQDADRFVEAARAFIKKITDGFADNFTTENGEVLVYDLLTAYEAVMEAYEGLDGAERSLPEVETEKEALDKAWGEIDDKYKEIDPDLYRFLRAVYALQKRYDGLKGKEQETYPWNLQLAYEGCLDQKSGFEEKFSDNADFVKAAPVLEEIGKWLDSLKELAAEDDGPGAGTYIAGSEPWDETASIPQTTMENAAAFQQLAETMEDGLAGIYAMCEWIQELTERYYNATNTDADRNNIRLEIDQLLVEIDRVAKSTEYDNWYGLVGGDAYAVTAFQDRIDNPMKIQIPSMTVSGLGLQGLGVLDSQDAEMIQTAVADALEKIAETRAEVGARKDLSNYIADAMQNWVWSGENDTAGDEHAFETSVKQYPPIDLGEENDAIPPSLDQALDLITNLQIFEGTLNTEHDMLQRMNEIAAKWVNDAGQTTDVPAVRAKLQSLSEGLTFLAEYVSYKGWHGLGGTGRLQVPMGWPGYMDGEEGGTCTYEGHIDIPISAVTAEDLGIGTVTGTEGAEAMQASILAAIGKVGLQRSIFGAWQNTCEHIVNLCEIRMSGVPLIGNEFDRGELPHVPIRLTGAFDKIYKDMQDRIYELEVRKADGVNTEEDKRSIDIEIQELEKGVNVLIDLIKTEVAVTPFVRLEESDPDGWHDLIRIDANETDYRYKLQYKALASNVKNVFLIDYIENGDDTVYAGLLTGVDLSGAETERHKVKVYVQTSQLAGREPSDDLPEALRFEAKGDWMLVEDPDTYDRWAYVTAVAFDFGDRTFNPIDTDGSAADGDRSASIELKMSSVYGGKPGCRDEEMPGAGYELYNTCKVYQRTGDSQDLVATDATYTKVVISYDTTTLSRPIRLPDTGGPGLMQFNRFGWILLLIALMMAGAEVRYFGGQRRKILTEGDPGEPGH